MSCRCTAITRLIKELDDLQLAQYYVQSAADSVMSTELNLAYGAAEFENGFSLMQKQYDISQGIRQVYNSAHSGVQDAYTAIRNEISSVNSTLSAYRKEDRAYHEKKRKSNTK